MKSTIRLPIGVDGISVAVFPSNSHECSRIILGTSLGRVRIYDSIDQNENCLYQRRWHKSIRSLSYLPSTSQLVSVSGHSGIKIHDLPSGHRVWVRLGAHGRIPISSLLTISTNVFATGDETGLVHVWDTRKPGDPCQSIQANNDSDSAEPAGESFGAVNDMAQGEKRNLILAALDNGSLAALNIRKARTEVLSDSLGYSARSLVVLPQTQHVLVGTEEGFLCLFNWDEFELVADRFSVQPQSADPNLTPSIEKLAVIEGNLVAVGTDDGQVSLVSVRPNQILGQIGTHPDASMTGADCLSIAYNSAHKLLASVCPNSSVVKLWPMDSWLMTEQTAKSSKQPRRRLSKLTAERAQHLSGLLPDPVDDEESAEDEDETDSDDSDDDDDESDSD